MKNDPEPHGDGAHLMVAPKCPKCGSITHGFSAGELIKVSRGLKGARCRRCVKDKDMLRKYHVGIDVFERMWEDQNARCYICEIQFAHESSAHVDHDHKTNAVRSLLCMNCNTAIGHLQEKPLLAARMIGYMAIFKGWTIDSEDQDSGNEIESILQRLCIKSEPPSTQTIIETPTEPLDHSPFDMSASLTPHIPRKSKRMPDVLANDIWAASICGDSQALASIEIDPHYRDDAIRLVCMMAPDLETLRSLLIDGLGVDPGGTFPESIRTQAQLLAQEIFWTAMDRQFQPHCTEAASLTPAWFAIRAAVYETASKGGRNLGQNQGQDHLDTAQLVFQSELDPNYQKGDANNMFTRNGNRLEPFMIIDYMMATGNAIYAAYFWTMGAPPSSAAESCDFTRPKTRDPAVAAFLKALDGSRNRLAGLVGATPDGMVCADRFFDVDSCDARGMPLDSEERTSMNPLGNPNFGVGCLEIKTRYKDVFEPYIDKMHVVQMQLQAMITKRAFVDYFIARCERDENHPCPIQDERMLVRVYKSDAYCSWMVMYLELFRRRFEDAEPIVHSMLAADRFTPLSDLPRTLGYKAPPAPSVRVRVYDHSKGVFLDEFLYAPGTMIKGHDHCFKGWGTTRVDIVDKKDIVEFDDLVRSAVIGRSLDPSDPMTEKILEYGNNRGWSPAIAPDEWEACTEMMALAEASEADCT